MNFKFEFRDIVFEFSCMLLDIFARTDFLGTHALAIVDKEDGDLGRTQQFPNLRLSRLLRLGCKSIVARLPDPMCFIANEGIDLAGRSISIVVKYLSTGLRAGADEFPKRLGECAGPSCVVSSSTFPEETCQKIDCEYGLTRPRTPSDDHHVPLALG